MVNINSTLCSQTIDPFAKHLDKWYYIISDFYIFLMGYISSPILKSILSLTSYLSRVTGYHKNKKSVEQDINEILQEYSEKKSLGQNKDLKSKKNKK